MKCGVRISPVPSSLWVIQCSLPGGKCLPGSRDMPGKSARCMSHRVWAVVYWGLMSLPPESLPDTLDTTVRWEDCGASLKALWQCCLSLLQTGNLSHTVLTLGHSMAPIVDFLHKGKRSVFVGFILSIFSVSYFSLQMSVALLRKNKTKKRCSW